MNIILLAFVKLAIVVTRKKIASFNDSNVTFARHKNLKGDVHQRPIASDATAL